ncbi:hypothetical protein IJ670_04950, partial [bacterium]|nr:hypothetical protein [bacterium]
IKYLEFINSIDETSNNLLYSKTDGYILKTSKEAIENYSKIKQKFKEKISNLTQIYGINVATEVINEKTQEFYSVVDEHYFRQIKTWAREVFDKTIDNCAFKISSFKNNQQMVIREFQVAKNAIEWINDFINVDKKSLIQETKAKLNNALKSKDIDFISKQNPEKSDISLFLKLREMILKDTNAFVKIDFSQYTEKLNLKDIGYLSKMQMKLKSGLFYEVKDEIELIDAAIEYLKKDETEQYNFICAINEDFISSNQMTEEDKIKIVKKRLDKFKNPNLKYFKEKILAVSYS